MKSFATVAVIAAAMLTTVTSLSQQAQQAQTTEQQQIAKQAAQLQDRLQLRQEELTAYQEYFALEKQLSQLQQQYQAAGQKAVPTPAPAPTKK